MAIEIVCKDCRSDYRVSDDKAGSTVKCRKCGARISVPDGDDEGEVFDRGISSRSKSVLPRKTSKKSSGGGMLAIQIGAGAVAFVIAFAVVVYSMGRRNNQEVAQANPPAQIPGAPNFPSPPGQASVPPGQISMPPGQTVPPGPGLSPAPFNNQAGNIGGNTPTTSLPKSAPGTALPGKNDAGQPPAPLPNAQANRAAGKRVGGFVGGDAGGKAGAGAGAGAEGRLPDEWNVKVDPATVDTKIDGAKPINMKFPKGSAHTDILYPASPSVFVALGANTNWGPIREIWNLSTKTKVGTVTTEAARGWAQSALSPDGQHLAIAHSQPPEGASVWITKTGKGLGSLTTDSKVTNLLFAGTTRLVGFCGDKTAKVWKLPSGELEHELNVEEGTDVNHSVPTPGGKYLAVVTDKSSLKMFNLETGAVAGELELPFGEVFFAGKPDALSISPDGAQLAMVMPTGVFEKDLVIYDLADGKLVKQVSLNVKDLGHGTDQLKSNRLEWFADRSKLLWRGHFVLDPEIGGPVWSAPQDDSGSDAPRKLLGNDKILMVVGGRQSPSLKVAPVPLAEIAASAKTVAQGGEASDAGMPTLSNADVTEVNPIATGAVGNWSMKPDPTSAAAKPPKASIALPRERPSIGGAFIANPTVGRAVVWYSDDFASVSFAKGLVVHNRKPPKTGPGTAMIDVVDLASGKSQTTVELPYTCTVLDVSPDGEAAAVKTMKPNQERIDVYSVNDGKHLAGWKPFHQQEDFFKDITLAKLIDSQHCLTQNFSGTTYMWKLPECKAVWKLAAAKNLCLSPGGKYLGFQAESRYLFMDARTGELVAELPVIMNNINCAFHFMGTHLAMLSSDGVSRKISVVETESGKITADFFAPQGNETVQWCGDTSLLVDGIWLVDLQQQKNAWQYNLGFGTRARTQPDGRHWFLASGGPIDQNVFLTGAQIPEKTVADKIAAAKLPDESLLKSGMQINLQVNLGATSPNHPNLVNDVTNNFRTGMQKNGFEVGAGSPYTFVVTTSQSNDGEPMQFRLIGRLGGESTVPRVKIDCEVALLQGGQPVWKHNTAVSNGTFGIVHLRENEDIGTHLSKQMWDQVAQHLTKFPVPAQVFGQTAGAGIGRSTLVPGGTQPGR